MESTQPDGTIMSLDPVAREKGSLDKSVLDKSQNSTPETGIINPSGNALSKDDLARAKEVELAREATRKAIEQGSILPSQHLGNLPAQPAGSKPAARVLGKVSGVSSMNTSESTTPPTEITLRTLLEAGAHFGHQTSRWNPAMSPYIYGSRNGIHIINLPKTVQAWSRAKSAIDAMAANGGNFLFVGTKKQAQDAIGEEARRCNSFYVAERWLGGMLTNFATVRKSVDRMKKLEEMLAEEDERAKTGVSFKFTKKERLVFSRELEKLVSSIGGIRDMGSLPNMMFVIDIRREEIAVKEARRLDIPVVALVDTNCDPAAVPYAVPSNDDGTRAIKLFSQAVADTILEGRKRYVPRPVEERTQNFDRREDRRDNRNNRARRPARSEQQQQQPVEVKQVAAQPVVEESPEAVQATPAEA